MSTLISAVMAKARAGWQWGLAAQGRRKGGREINFHLAMPDNCQVGRAIKPPRRHDEHT